MDELSERELFRKLNARKQYLRDLAEEMESSGDESEMTRSGDTSAQPEPNNDAGRSPENLTEAEYEAEDEGAGAETSVEEPIDEEEAEFDDEDFVGEPIDEEEEEEAEFEPNKASDSGFRKEAQSDHHETARKPSESHHEGYDRREPNPWINQPNPWFAECDFGTARLNYPVYSANHQQPQPDPQPVFQAPDPGPLYRDELAQPLIRASWAGDFAIYSSGPEAPARCGWLKGCVSTKACAQARAAVERLPAAMRWEKVPKYRVWPKSFERWGPNDNNIAVYFFPSLTKHEAPYDSLVMELVRDDLALKTTVMGAELLLFTSVELPPLFTRFQGKLYLWGVFRGKRPHL